MNAKFSQYGLVYNTRIFIADDRLGANDIHRNVGNDENFKGSSTKLVQCYAFVDFYSAKAALKTLRELTCRILTGGKPAKVEFR